MTDSKRVLLMILDGFGEAPDDPGNAISQADMTFMKKLRDEHPWTLLKAAGNAVGLPNGYQGNSEVGHFTMGSGRITNQSLEEIDQSIKNGDFFEMESFVNACQLKKKKALHLLGMISDEGVHSHLDHLFALLKLAKEQNAFPIYIHAILDGRDVPERSAHIYLKQIQDKIEEMGLNEPMSDGGPAKASIATMVGRYFAMDRDQNWVRTQEAYDLLIHGDGIKETDPIQAVQNAYDKGTETDYYVPPVIFNEHGVLKEDDSVIFFNYRTDRTRQLTDALLNKKFEHFNTDHGDLNFVAMGPYTDLAPVAFPTPEIKDNLGDTLAKNKKFQLRMAETEKYAHVSYFFNSQMEDPRPMQDKFLVDSPKVPSYADTPEMSAKELTDELLEQLKREEKEDDKYSLLTVNYANADLVGHSGDLKAAIKACQTLDESLSRVIPEALKHDYTVLITADHGNAEEMLYDNGDACPSHTKNPVPFLLVANDSDKYKLKEGKGLQDVAPTVLDLLDVPKPDLMTGESLLK
jgi:2,3-bisphosphoglycerate-independent phosphoglycerate mutase